MKLFLILSLIALNINIYSQDYYEDRLFIKLKNEYQDNLDLTKDKSINFILSKYDKAKFQKAFRSYEMRSVYEVQFKDKVDLTRLIAQLEKYEYIEYAEKIPIYKLFYTPNDPQYSSQWNLAKIQADLAWNLSQGCSGIKVAITDDGFLMNHEDLVNQWYINSVDIPGNGVDEDGNGYIDDWRGWDAANNDNDPSAFNPTNSYFTHGTHVAGIAGGATNNSLGIASIGFNNKLIPIKIGRDIDGALTGPYQGLDYAINATTCDVINMSWGGGAFSTTYQILFNLAYSNGIICVAAAGNSNLNTAITPMYPAAYNHVISVAASTSTDAKAGFSNYGSNIDVTAPGANILSCLAGGISSYGNLSGTSMASPLVAGLCGLMKCYNPMPVDSIEACLKRTCDNINAQNPSYLGQLGAGRINAFQALQCLTQKPVSDFYAKDTQQCIGKPVRYFATSFGIPTLTYSWTFPGGSPPSSTFKNPQVTYAANGTYSATLTTTNGVGSHTVTKTNIVTIGAPKASLIGRKYTSYNSNAVVVTVKFTGNPPFNVTLSDGTNNFTQNNITANPYYFSIVPLKDTSYISISSFQDTQCVGTKLGQDTIYKITLGSGSTSYCESSFKFNGTSNNVVKIDKYNGANWKDLYSTNGYTWECWFNLGNRNGSNVTGIESLVAASDAIFCEDLGLHFNWPWAGGGKLNWVISGQGGCSGSVPRGVISTNMTFNANTWYHAAGVMDYSTNTVLLYVNGQQVASGTITIPLALRMQNNVAVTIGNQDVNFNPYSSFSPFNGKIDEVRFWNSVRTPAEIQANYKTCLPATTSNLVAYFKGDEGAGTSTVSKINGNFVGTLQNGTSWDVQVDSVKNCTICTTSLCKDSIEITSAQTGWEAMNTSGTWGSLTSCNYVTSLFAANASNFPGMNIGDCLWGPIVQSPSRTYYNSSSQTTTSTGNASVPIIRKQFTLPTGAYIDSVRLWMLSDDFVDSVLINSTPVYNSAIPIIYGQVLFTKNAVQVGNGQNVNYVTVKPGDFGGNYGTYFRMKLYYSKVCNSVISDCDTTNLNTGLVLNLPFNGNTLDISGKGNHATNFGATLATGKAGVANTAYKFNGSTNYMKVFNSSTLGLNSAYTVTCKLKIDGWNTAPCHGNMIFFKGNTAPVAGNQHFDWVYAPNAYNGGCISALDTLHQNLFPGTTTVGSPYSYTPYLQRFKWYCFAVVQKNDTLYNYIDGVMVYKTPNTGTGTNPYDIFIGRSNYPSYPYWLNATIDDIRVYNRSLETSEVKGYCGTCNQDTVCKSVNNSSCWVKDAAVSTYTPNTNYSTHPECLSASWTCGGSPCQARSYFDFNLSQIPTNAVIESAKLYLYAVPNSTNNGYTGQPTYGTNNASVIQRVIQSWDENTITWTNKPNTTAVNQATLSQSTGLLQNYVVDMKNLIIDHRANLATSYGFMLKHIAEGTNMNSMIFGSTDNPNPALRPRLDICYSVPSGSPINASPPSECDSNSCDTTNLNTGLVLNLPFNGNTNDVSGNGNHATNNGATPVTGKNGIANNAYRFNGMSNFMQITNSSSLNNISTITMTAILKPKGFYDGPCKNNLIINKSNTESISGWYSLRYNPEFNVTCINQDTNKNKFVSYYNTSNCIGSITNASQNVKRDSWYCVVSTYDADTHKMYINGFLSYQCKLNAPIGSNTQDLFIGKLNIASAPYWLNAEVDDIRIYNRVLAPSEVKGYCGVCSISQPPSKPCDTARKFVFLKCTNDILQLNARQGRNYQWSPTTGLSSDTIRNPFCTVKSTTTYLVLYTDTNGCQLIDTVNVMVKKAAFYSPLDDQLICNGDSVQLTIPIKATGIIWSPNTGISNVNFKSPYFYPSTTTTYYLQFIDSLGCPQFDTIVVNVKPCCAARARFKISNNLVCFGSNIFITNTSKNSTTYNWSFPNAIPSSFTGANPPALSFPSGNSYPIRLIVSNGICFDTMIQSVSVVQVKPNAGKDTATCLANLTVNIGETAISDWSYKWTPTTYLNNATISDPLCTMINDSINYIIEVTDRSSGCKGYDTVQVKTNQKVDSIVASAIICQGESILFNSISINTSGKYFYTIKKLNSICDSFINIQYVKVLSPTNIIQSPEIYCNFYIDKKGKRHDTSYTRRDTIKYKSLITCDSIRLTTRVNIFKTKYDSVTLTACKEVNFKGKKYSSSKRNIDSIKIIGPYSGCDSIITRYHAVVKPIPNAQITASKPNLLNYGDTVTLTASGGFTYLWSPTNSTNTSIVHISEDTIYHTYIVTVTDTNSCWDTAMYRVKGRFPDTLYYGIPNIFSPNGDGRNDIFIPNMNYGVKILDFYIWNRWGEKMWESHDNHGWDGFYKNKPAPASVYVYYVMFQTPWGKREYKGSFTLIR